MTPTPIRFERVLALAVGRTFRDARLSLGLSQRQLEARCGIAQSAQSRFERGLPSAIDLDAIERLAAAMGGRVRLVFDAPFLNDRARQRDRLHALCIGHVARRLRRHGWLVETEVEIAGTFGPGWIDVLAFHPESGRLLVIEIKTEIRDLGRTHRPLAWYESRAVSAARGLGWRVRGTHGALLVLATAAVDQAIRENRSLVTTAFPVRARDLATFVERPDSPQLEGRSLALIDPLSRRAKWLRSSTLDGRRTPAPHADYADVVRTLERQRAQSRSRHNPR